jgi:hypothetical protein
MNAACYDKWKSDSDTQTRCRCTRSGALRHSHILRLGVR